jgi:hypothetical protein
VRTAEPGYAPIKSVATQELFRKDLSRAVDLLLEGRRADAAAAADAARREDVAEIAALPAWRSPTSAVGRWVARVLLFDGQERRAGSIYGPRPGSTPRWRRSTNRSWSRLGAARFGPSGLGYNPRDTWPSSAPPARARPNWEAS